MIKIKFVGDIMLGELIENAYLGVESKINRGVDPFKYCKDDFKDADVVVGNLECLLIDHRKGNKCTLQNTNKCNFDKCIFNECCAPLHHVTLLKEAGITVFNLANNHTKDRGTGPLLDMISHLNANNIMHFGYSEKLCEQYDPMVLTVHGVRIGFLGYNLANMNESELNKSQQYITDRISESKSGIDVLILSLHWGLEYVNFPCEPYISMAKAFVNAGADIIFGHHSHQLQGYINSNNKVIMFSMGNFIFDDLRKENRYTGVLEVLINPDDCSIQATNLIPYYINSDFQPIPMKGTDTKYFLKLTELAELIYSTDKYEEKHRFQKKCEKISKFGHIKNRTRIRCRILLNLSIHIKYLLCYIRFLRKK
jgi:poly-gamma-glutamate synthesis protein (capsule biosynthesis protein)